MAERDPDGGALGEREAAALDRLVEEGAERVGAGGAVLGAVEEGRPSTVRAKEPVPRVPKVCSPLARGVNVPVISTVSRVSWVTPSGRSAPIHWIWPLGSGTVARTAPEASRQTAVRSNPASAMASSSLGSAPTAYVSAPSGRAAVSPSSGETTWSGKTRAEPPPSTRASRASAPERATVVPGASGRASAPSRTSLRTSTKERRAISRASASPSTVAGRSAAGTAGGADSRAPTRAASRRMFRTARSTIFSSTSPARTASARASP
ncbi:hypothetical protein ACN24K_18960 [Streptomyces microflavus]